MRVSSVSVLICTYAAFRDALAARDVPGELIVVDNNSTDGTRQAVEEAASRSTIPIRYAHECRQGKSFALNTGLAMARGDVLALTDDDVEPAPDWLDRSGPQSVISPENSPSAPTIDPASS